MLKKIMASIIALAALTGCPVATDKDGAVTEKPVVTEKTVVNAMGYGNPTADDGMDWIRIVNSFMAENPDIIINYEMLYDVVYHNRVSTRLASGDIPDFAYMGADVRWGTPWRINGQQFDMKALIDPAVYDLTLIPSMGPNGEIYEIPLGTQNITSVLFMNEGLVTSLGLTKPATYADLKDLVAPATAAGCDVISINGADSWAWSSCLLSSIIARVSGDAHWVSKAVAGINKFDDQEFIDSLTVIKTMVDDGVIKASSVTDTYEDNITRYNEGKALFFIQGQWAANAIVDSLADTTSMLPLPTMPGEKPGFSAAVGAAIQVGYGITKSGSLDPKVRDAALKFINYFHSEKETTKRFRDGAIVAPILKDYSAPADLPEILKEKMALSRMVMIVEVIDVFLGGNALIALNDGLQDIVSGTSTPAQVAEAVEALAALAR